MFKARLRGFRLLHAFFELVCPVGFLPMLECKPIIIGLIVGSGSPKLVKFGGGGCGGGESHAMSKYTQTRPQ